MTEKEKAKNQMLYDGNYDEEMLKERDRCKDLCFKFNNTLPSNKKEQQNILNELLGKVGKSPVFTAPFWCDYGYNIEIGDDFYTNHNCVMLDGAKISIGNNVFIGPNCCLSTAGHPIDFERRNKGLEYAYPITIGNNVWLGANVSVLPGTTIGDNIVIGAGCVVNRNVPSNTIVAGNPCKIIREITQEDKNGYTTKPIIKNCK